MYDQFPLPLKLKIYCHSLEGTSALLHDYAAALADSVLSEHIYILQLSRQYVLQKWRKIIAKVTERPYSVTLCECEVAIRGPALRVECHDRGMSWSWGKDAPVIYNNIL